MKKVFYLFSFVTFIIITSCNNETVNPITNNTDGKIKTISFLSEYGDEGTLRFYYKENGLLDYFTENDSVYHYIDSILINSVINNSLVTRLVDNYSLEWLYDNAPDTTYFIYNNNNLTYRKRHDYHLSNHEVYEIDSLYYDNSNLNKQIHHEHHDFGYNGTGNHSYRYTFNYYYDLTKNSSLTNENIGMPYFGNSSKNVLDSINYTYCEKNYIDPYIDNDYYCQDMVSFKVINEYDNLGRIIKTNALPLSGLFFINFLPTVTVFFDNTYFEITYY
ncbi:MAG: hypothetical protein H6553_08295 [Chitinophagales bacterium]|nr:hypothetical protein [Chitinophagales bacterium]